MTDERLEGTKRHRLTFTSRPKEAPYALKLNAIPKRRGGGVSLQQTKLTRVEPSPRALKGRELTSAVGAHERSRPPIARARCPPHHRVHPVALPERVAVALEGHHPKTLAD